MDIRADDLRTSRDLYEKLQREAERFEQTPVADHLFNFMMTARSLTDWLVQELGRAITRTPAWATLWNDPAVQICRAIATSSTHAMIEHRHRRQGTTGTPRPSTPSGGGSYGSGLYGGGGDYIIIDDAGNSYGAREVIAETLDRYEAFFTHHGL